MAFFVQGTQASNCVHTAEGKLFHHDFSRRVDLFLRQHIPDCLISNNVASDCAITISNISHTQTFDHLEFLKVNNVFPFCRSV